MTNLSFKRITSAKASTSHCCEEEIIGKFGRDIRPTLMVSLRDFLQKIPHDSKVEKPTSVSQVHRKIYLNISTVAYYCQYHCLDIK